MVIIRTLDELGRIVIPVDVRRSVDLEKGDKIGITVEDGKIILQKMANGK